MLPGTHDVPGLDLSQDKLPTMQTSVPFSAPTSGAVREGSLHVPQKHLSEVPKLFTNPGKLREVETNTVRLIILGWHLLDMGRDLIIGYILRAGTERGARGDHS